MQATIPTGTVTFLFTDIEGSTRLWELHPESMQLALSQHDRLLHEAINKNNGYVFKTVGDAFCAAFTEPNDAVNAALGAQLALHDAQWPDTGPLFVRMCIHSGSSHLRDNDYFGPTLNRTARLLAIVKGGQVVLSQATQQLVQDRLPHGSQLEELGDFTLKDLKRPERAYRLTFEGMAASPGVTVSAALPWAMPHELSAFVGRKSELDALAEKLRTHRMVTISGPGGVGKTRLAVRLASQERERFTGGTAFADLTPAKSESEAIAILSKACGARSAVPDLNAIAQTIGHAPMLLVLDNCEHVLDVARHTARTLLQEAPDVTILATSREPLHLAGEQIFDLWPLAVPTENATLAQLLQNDSVQLLLSHASLDSSYAQHRENARAIGQLCRHLDGIPLALELAAARLRTLSPHQIVERLNRRFALLTVGDKTGPSHHWTLARAIDWSYEQLQSQERELYSRLTVFESPFTLDAVEAVCSSDSVPLEDVMDILSQLTDKSFLRYDRKSERYQFLETLRAYALERLEECQLPTLRARHAEFFRGVVTCEHLDATANAAWLEDIDESLADVHAAMQHAIVQDADAALEMGLALRLFWIIRGYYDAGHAMLRAAERAKRDEVAALPGRATMLASAALLSNSMGHHEDAIAEVEEARQLFAACDDRRGLAQATNTLGTIYDAKGEQQQAYALFQKAAELYDECGEFRRSAMPLLNLGLLAADFGDLNEAERHLRAAARRAGDAGDIRVAAWAEGALGEVAASRSNCDDAKHHYMRWIEQSRSLGDKASICTALTHMGELAVEISECGVDPIPLFSEALTIATEHTLLLPLSGVFEGIARVALRSRDAERAAILLAAADSLRAKSRNLPRASERRHREEVVAAGRALNAPEFDAAYEKTGPYAPTRRYRPASKPSRERIRPAAPGRCARMLRVARDRWLSRGRGRVQPHSRFSSAAARAQPCRGRCRPLRRSALAKGFRRREVHASCRPTCGHSRARTSQRAAARGRTQGRQ